MHTNGHCRCIHHYLGLRGLPSIEARHALKAARKAEVHRIIDFILDEAWRCQADGMHEAADALYCITDELEKGRHNEQRKRRER
jgi:hypothetical protein